MFFLYFLFVERTTYIPYFCTMQYHKVILSLGSNLGNKKAYLEQAVAHIHHHIGFVAQTSFIYETPAWGFESDPFYNLCILVHTHAAPEKLLTDLKALEKQLGRTTKSTNGYAARTIDIDIIYFDDLVLETPDLTVPHPQMQLRQFVLVPLNDLTFDDNHPTLHQTTKELLQQCPDDAPIKKAGTLTLPKNQYSLPNIHFLAIEGNIGSGKTTLAQKIAQDFATNVVLERFADNPFLPKFYKEPQRYAFPLEMSFLADRYSQLNEDLNQLNLFSEFVVADYYIYKSLIFAQVTLEHEEAQLYRTIFEVMYKETAKPDVYVYLYQNTPNLLLNIQKRGRSYETSIPADYLDKINQSYSEFIKTLPQENVLIIDVTDKDFVANHEDYLEILKQISEKIER